MKGTYKKFTLRLLTVACAMLGVTACGSKQTVSDNKGPQDPPPTVYGPPPTSIHIGSGSNTDAPADNPGFHIGQ